MKRRKIARLRFPQRSSDRPMALQTFLADWVAAKPVTKASVRSVILLCKGRGRGRRGGLGRRGEGEAYEGLLSLMAHGNPKSAKANNVFGTASADSSEKSF